METSESQPPIDNFKPAIIPSIDERINDEIVETKNNSEHSDSNSSDEEETEDQKTEIIISSSDEEETMIVDQKNEVNIISSDEEDNEEKRFDIADPKNEDNSSPSHREDKEETEKQHFMAGQKNKEKFSSSTEEETEKQLATADQRDEDKMSVSDEEENSKELVIVNQRNEENISVSDGEEHNEQDISLLDEEEENDKVIVIAKERNQEHISLSDEEENETEIVIAEHRNVENMSLSDGEEIGKELVIANQRMEDTISLSDEEENDTEGNEENMSLSDEEENDKERVIADQKNEDNISLSDEEEKDKELADDRNEENMPLSDEDVNDKELVIADQEKEDDIYLSDEEENDKELVIADPEMEDTISLSDEEENDKELVLADQINEENSSLSHEEETKKQLFVANERNEENISLSDDEEDDKERCKAGQKNDENISLSDEETEKQLLIADDRNEANISLSDEEENKELGKADQRNEENISLLDGNKNDKEHIVAKFRSEENMSLSDEEEYKELGKADQRNEENISLLDGNENDKEHIVAKFRSEENMSLSDEEENKEFGKADQRNEENISLLDGKENDKEHIVAKFRSEENMSLSDEEENKELGKADLRNEENISLLDGKENDKEHIVAKFRSEENMSLSDEEENKELGKADLRNEENISLLDGKENDKEHIVAKFRSEENMSLSDEEEYKELGKADQRNEENISLFDGKENDKEHIVAKFRSEENMSLSDEEENDKKLVIADERNDVNVSSSHEEDTQKQLSIAVQKNEENKTSKESKDLQLDDSTKRTQSNEEIGIEEHFRQNEIPTQNAFQNQQDSCDTEKDLKVNENNFKLIDSPIHKLNGNHSLSLNDEDTCSSTTSSASSHNLVIDHPLAEEQPLATSIQENTEFNMAGKINETKSLKRKLSFCENDSPRYKNIHLDAGIRSPEKYKGDHAMEVPLMCEVPKDSNTFESFPREPDLWGKGIAGTNFSHESFFPIKARHFQTIAKFVEKNDTPHPSPPSNLSQRIQRNYAEENRVTIKERPPPTNELYHKYQSSSNSTTDSFKEISAAPGKFMSPQSYGPYPIYASNSLPPTSCSTELSALVTKQMPQPKLDSRVAAITSLKEKESNHTQGLYDHYTTQSGKRLPAPKLNFQCFKCKIAVFENFNQLREHHKVCLFQDSRRKLQIPKASKELQPIAKNKTVSLINSSGAPETPSSVPTPSTPKKRFYLCSSCGTYHENWNLFLHIREIHNRHVCLYCIRLFPTAEKLSLHLEIKHDLEQNHFNSEEKLRSVSKSDGNSRFLMCCTCQHVFSEHERFSDHVCSEYIQPCSLCGQKGRHLSNCKAYPEKRPKAKRKTKMIAPPPPPTPVPVIATSTKGNSKIPKVSTTLAALLATGKVCDSKFNRNNNNSQKVLSIANLPTISSPLEFSKQNGYSDMPPLAVGCIGGTTQNSEARPPSEDCNYHSDDSTNMVIDETCITNNYFDQMPAVNPFKALDERERLQDAVQKISEVKSTLPPDRVPEAIPEPKPLIVPKIKLCVPREFQKAVDMEVSSTDSNEEDAEDEQEDRKDETREEKSLSFEKSWTKNTWGNDSSSNEEKDSNQDDGCELNSKLDRILKAIEKTQSEIRRTKEKMMRSSPATADIEHKVENPPPVEVMIAESIMSEVPPIEAEISIPEPAVQQTVQEQKQEELESLPIVEPTSEFENYNLSPNMQNEKVVWVTPERRMYSPTPPPTPNSAWPSPFYQMEDSPTILQAVSERENIENMEKECEHAKEQSPVEMEKMDSSGGPDLGAENVQNQEESTMDIEERSKQTPPNSSLLDVMDFTLSTDNENKLDVTGTTEPEIDDEDEEIEVVKEYVPPADGIEVANDDILITDLFLDRPIEKFEIIEFVRLCLKAVYSLCLYCNHARRIAVCGHSLVLHLLAQHRFSATVDSITAEELLPSTIVSKLKSFLPVLEEHYFNLESYSSKTLKDNSTNVVCNERIFECFQCRFSTRMHKDLYLHNRKMHLKTAILCFMCRSNFFSFSEILCHICPGTPNKTAVFDIKFRCCLCDVDGIPSPFRLMVHLRKKHFACDICLEDCHLQAKLSSHVWKHKLHHLCYRCGIAYRNKMDITKHLFWKHGTESIICKRCLQKRWRHVYHFCVPPSSFTCDVCNLCFSKATYLKVHQREHTGDYRYPCTEDNCEEKFVSRKLLLKHSAAHASPPEVKTETANVEIEEANNEKQEIEFKEEESIQQEEKPLFVQPTDVKEEEKEGEAKVAVENKVEQIPEVGSKRKKKRNRNKESLEDLNLIAPNLSESDSSSDSDTERSKTDDKDSLVPNVMLSPPSEEEKEEDKPDEADKDAGKIIDIWENFKTFQASQQPKKNEEDDVKSFTDSDYPTPILHVASSDHDYCAMYKIRQRVLTEDRSAELPVDSEPVDMASDDELKVQELIKHKESLSPTKTKGKSTGSHSSSSGSTSDSSSRSSCSCKTNCSCSSSSSGSGSSSSSDDSDSSTSEGRRRIAKKRQERVDRNRVKSETSLKVSNSENVDVGGVNENEPIIPEVKQNLNPIFIETDLETAESETDEEFYDEHPQKLASEILAQKRLQLQEQMRLSPSHSFDIMENSRPSTPSLPEEMVKEKKVKLKKKKRDRKSTCKSQQAVPPIKLNLSINKVEILNNEPVIQHQIAMQVPEVDLIPPYDLIASPGIAEPPVAQQPISTSSMQMHTVKPVPFLHSRMSEGSSCSDADSSLKRSQRARRPNKFYGYTSDDENLPGTPLMIGTRTFKPQPPPQLTWRKEDLPAPSKSILFNKPPRTPKTPVGQKGIMKKRLHQKTSSSKKKQHRLPPIPTIKIRPPKINRPPVVAVVLPPPPPPITNNQSYSSSRDDSDDSDSSDDDLELPATNTVPTALAVPTWNPAPPPVVIEPPPPQASVFNQKIPPALLPNPDLATIQYFKRNNIRYPIRPPAGARQPREGESVYCYCRCPYDEVSEMIACDGENCLIEWFHFECVGIMVAPQGKWFCAECRPNYSNELYPQLS